MVQIIMKLMLRTRKETSTHYLKNVTQVVARKEASNGKFRGNEKS